MLYALVIKTKIQYHLRKVQRRRLVTSTNIAQYNPLTLCSLRTAPVNSALSLHRFNWPRFCC